MIKIKLHKDEELLESDLSTPLVHADLISINQNDIREQRQYVAQMSTVCSQVIDVWIWFGSARKDIAIAAYMFRASGEEMQGRQEGQAHL